MSLFNSGNCCRDLSLREHFSRNTISSIIAGILFAVGWWLIIDATCSFQTHADFNKVFHIIGVIGTVALILINAVSNSQFRGDSYSESCLGKFGSGMVLFVAFLLLFGSLISSAWVMFASYIIPKKTVIYPGVAIFGQNLAIFVSAVVLKFGRSENTDF